MCIRDRLHDDLGGLLDEVNELVVLGNEVGLSVDLDDNTHLAPVSYTHLDVYKRQVLGLNIVFHSFKAYKNAEHNSEAKV